MSVAAARRARNRVEESHPYTPLHSSHVPHRAGSGDSTLPSVERTEGRAPYFPSISWVAGKGGKDRERLNIH